MTSSRRISARRLLRVVLVPTLLLTLVLVLVFAGAASASKPVPPIVSTQWMAHAQGVVIVDVRASGYADSHIPGSISIPGFPVGPWSVGTPFPFDTPDPTDGLWMEFPTAEDLSSLLASKGITRRSTVVVVGGPGDPIAEYGYADATRVAMTLIYAGVKNVAILDGGFPQWVADGLSVTTAVPVVTPVQPYAVCPPTGMVVDTEYVWQHIGRSIIIDARDEAVYLGEALEPWTPDYLGHIPTAVSLPAPLIWEPGGVYKPASVLQAMVIAAIGHGKGKEIIVYCGVGGYGSSWWFVLTQILGYRHVKFYDGSAQAWYQGPNAWET
jgi:thiosulfate/3-mercaptopyruvate sulfurtransferase